MHAITFTSASGELRLVAYEHFARLCEVHCHDGEEAYDLGKHCNDAFAAVLKGRRIAFVGHQAVLVLDRGDGLVTATLWPQREGEVFTVPLANMERFTSDLQCSPG